MAIKPLVWVGTSLARVRAFPDDARRAAGYQLYRVQTGSEPEDWKPMRSVGTGVVEIRVHEGGEFRVLYVAKFGEAIYVLHGFQKKSAQTRDADVDIARRNVAEVLRGRREN